MCFFQGWSELQKEDFLEVLSEKMAGVEPVNGVVNGLADLSVSNGNGSGRPMSLFHCQMKLFREWCSGWSDDQKAYLVMRIKDLDGEFHTK